MRGVRQIKKPTSPQSARRLRSHATVSCDELDSPSESTRARSATPAAELLAGGGSAPPG